MPGRPTTLVYGRSGACFAGAARVGYVFLLLLFCFFLISSVLASFSNASCVGKRLDILKYCGLGRCNPAVVVSYYRRRAR